MSVDAAEALWSATPAKAAWVIVSPQNAGYYEFPNYTANTPTCNISQYLQPFWKCDTIYNELVLLNGVNSMATLLFKPKKIISVTNYDFSQTFIENKDYSVQQSSIQQLSERVSASVVIVPGKQGNGKANGLINTQASSWTCVTYIPDRTINVDIPLSGYKGDKLPLTMAKLQQGKPIIMQAYGMSITAGLNVSGFAGDDKNFPPTKPYMHSYIDLLKNALEAQFGSTITMLNGSCGGKTVAWIDTYCESMVIPNKPDLVILDMGMGDIWGYTTNAVFREKMQSCINKIKNANPATEFILIANMLPDINSPGAPKDGDQLMYGFLSQLKSLENNGIVVFDMTSISDTIYKRKGAVHCLSNALHPNDYLARWYAQGLAELFIKSSLAPVQSKKYYVNTSGNNTDGLSIENAWTDLSKINEKKFNPGDTIVFEANTVYNGNIEFDENDGNSPEKPIIITTYGNGMATIATKSSNKCGFKAINTQGFHLSNLKFTGPGNSTQKDIDGILFFTNKTTGYLRNIKIINCDVNGFSYCGIRFYSDWNAQTKAGYKDVLIDSCAVYDCRENGIVTIAYDDQAARYYNHRNFIIRNTQVFNITGYAAAGHKGSGIVLSQIDSSLIEHCVAYNNGKENTACGGPGGIWVWSADAITIQFCESHHNSSGKSTGCDGLGFDLDGGVTNSIIQYCYSHDNDGAGYLLGNFPGARPWGNNTVRFCISANDARTNNSAVTLFTANGTKWNGLNFYNNTIYTTPSANNKYPSFGAFQMTDFGNEMLGVACYNNIFITKGGLPLLTVPQVFASQNPKFAGNLYYAADQPFLIEYGKKYNSLTAFRNAGPYCEKVGIQSTGFDINPLLINTENHPLMLYPKPTDSLDAFLCSDASPVINAGLDLQNLFGIDRGQRDFFGNPLRPGTIADIGAHEWVNAISGISISDNPLMNAIVNAMNNQYIQLDLPAHYFESCYILVYDIMGKVVRREFITPGLNHFSITGLNPGLYSAIIVGTNTNIPFTFLKNE